MPSIEVMLHSDASSNYPVELPIVANIVTTMISMMPNKISAPKPSALPVFAFLTKEVLLRTALPPIVIAAIAAGKAATIR